MQRHTSIQVYKHTGIHAYKHSSIQIHKYTSIKYNIIQAHKHTSVQVHKHTSMQAYRPTRIQAYKYKIHKYTFTPILSHLSYTLIGQSLIPSVVAFRVLVWLVDKTHPVPLNTLYC